MKARYVTGSLTVAILVFIVGLTIAAQDRGAPRVLNGLALSDFHGYESWQVIAPSQTDDGLKAILGNPVMIKAYAEGIPGNGHAVPDGAMMAKIEWSKESNTVSPYPVNVPGTLKSLAFMMKDAKRFAASGGWGYAKFTYDSPSNTLTPSGTGSGCGYECHTRVKARDFVFTNYGRR
jgi:Cytochrome P460